MSASISRAGHAMPARSRRSNGLLVTLLNSWADRCRARQDRERLHRMPDHLLADIGLSRDSLD
jgi:uncharacterized protein YjiS (DUF1127 family)